VPKYPIVHRVLGKFMMLPRDHVNAFIVEMKSSVVVIDATLALSSARDLRKKAEALGKPVEAVLVTHGHPDHYTGLKVFEDLPRLGSQGCLEFAHREDIVKAPTATHYLGDDYPTERVFPHPIIKDGDTFTFGGVKFTFRDLGPGESDSDGLWTYRADGVDHVFVGDTVAMNCHCFFRDGHVRDWNRILDRLLKDYGSSARLYLGHGESPCGLEAIDWQRGYNRAFEVACAALKARRAPIDPAARSEVIASMMRYLPNEATFFLLDYELEKGIELMSLPESPHTLQP